MFQMEILILMNEGHVMITQIMIVYRIVRVLGEELQYLMNVVFAMQIQVMIVSRTVQVLGEEI